MFGIGFMELMVIAVAILIFVGPQKMPELMRQAGRFFVQMRRTASEVRSTFDGVVQEAEAELRREEFAKIKQAIGEAKDTLTAPPETEEYDPNHHHREPTETTESTDASQPHDPKG